MLREEGSYDDDYPHFLCEFDSEGNIVDFHSATSRKGPNSRWGRDEVIRAALAFVKGKGML